MPDNKRNRPFPPRHSATRRITARPEKPPKLIQLREAPAEPDVKHTHTSDSAKATATTAMSGTGAGTQPFASKSPKASSAKSSVQPAKEAEPNAQVQQVKQATSDSPDRVDDTGQEGTDISRLVRGVWTRSIIGLTVVALLATATFLIINGILSLNKDSGAIVNISGAQRMLSQRGTLFALQLSTTRNEEARATVRSQLESVIKRMREAHEGLTKGSEKMGLPEAHSAAIDAIYFDAPHELDKQVTTYLGHLETLVAESLTAAPERSHPSLQYVLREAPDTLLTTLNLAVKQYENEANTKLEQAIDYETLLYLLTLLTLVLEALIIYRPLVNRIRHTTEDLLQQQQFSDRVIDTSQALIIGVDKEGKIALFNDYSEALTGYRLDDIKGQSFVDTLIPDDERQTMTQHQARLFAGVRSDRLESTLLTKAGKLLTVEWSDTVLSDPLTRKPIMLLATGVDITQRKQAEKSLTTALDKSAALSDRLQEEVSHAARLQQALLPEPVVDLPGVRGLAKLTTSTEVGGDYFDYYDVDGYHSVFLVGDVSGHGVASGTLVSAAKMGVHQLASRGETDPAVMLEHLNSALLTASHDNMFMTMICFSLDSRSGVLRVANAGHVFPYLWLSGEADWGMVEAEGVPLGRVDSPQYLTMSLELEVGDRLVLYTDGIVEEENADGEAFGFERFENVLFDIAPLPPETAQAAIFAELTSFCERDTFSDDVTVMLVEHHERVEFVDTALAEKRQMQQAQDAALMLDSVTFMNEPDALPDHASRQHVVLTYSGDAMSDLLIPLCREGVRRVLNSDQAFLRELGWESLLAQHELPMTDDVYQWISLPTLEREWVLTHSDDKAFIMQEVAGLLAETPNLSEDMQDIALLMSDELLENSLYGAPRTDGNMPRYAKGTARVVEADEGIRINLLHDNERFGLMVTDHWGTFTPATFLNRLLLNTVQQGIEAGVGGAGMYLMWRMCDYLQIRVLPNQQTQVTLLWSLKASHDPDTDSGFQFLYHNELNELVLEEDMDEFEVYPPDDYSADAGNTAITDTAWRAAV